MKNAKQIITKIINFEIYTENGFKSNKIIEQML